MESDRDSANELVIPQTLQAEIRAVAIVANRSADEIVREALEVYLAHQQHVEPQVPDAQTRAATVTRMLQRRSDRRLPKGVTIEDVIAWGRDGRA